MHKHRARLIDAYSIGRPWPLTQSTCERCARRAHHEIWRLVLHLGRPTFLAGGIASRKASFVVAVVPRFHVEIEGGRDALRVHVGHSEFRA